MSAPELILWQRIRNNQLGVKFRRQYTIENRILDFYSPQVKLGIEIDGESHFKSDNQRTKELKLDQELFEKYEIKIIRFLNTEIMKNLENVLIAILKEIIVV